MLNLCENIMLLVILILSLGVLLLWYKNTTNKQQTPVTPPSPVTPVTPVNPPTPVKP